MDYKSICKIIKINFHGNPIFIINVYKHIVYLL
jgi:hypothetical protein